MKIAIVFPGYGGQYVGMGKELYDNSRIVQEYFEEASSCLDINFVKLCFASSDAEISKIEHALVANFLVSSSIFAVLKEQNIIPDVVLGYTSGQYAAIFAGGGINFPDMLYLIQKYVNFYQDLLAQKSLRAMRVVGITPRNIEEALVRSNADAFISVYETANSNIVGGSMQTMDALGDVLKDEGATKVIALEQVEGFHSPIMKPVEEQMRLYSEKVDFKDLTIPLIAGTSTERISSRDDVKAEMFNQIVKPLQWFEVARNLSYDVIIEVGPGTMLRDMLRKMHPNAKIIAVNREADIASIPKD